MVLSTQIEQALQRINDTTFQQLVNHYLYYQYPMSFHSPGTVVAKEKTKKGIPDGFFQIGNSFLFVESTTKEQLPNRSSFFKKLTSDINSCFNTSKTNISVKKISKVVLAFTDEISPTEVDQLKQLVNSHNSKCTLELLGIQRLSLELQHYSWLLKDYLSINVTKGQIYPLDKFLAKKGHQPSLDNPFLYREEEIKDCLNKLKDKDILVLSGLAGTGKSKLAIEIANRLWITEGYTSLVIQSSPVPLYDDFNLIFQPNKKYLVVFDDANKAINNLHGLTNLMEDSKLINIKLIVTVRDYIKADLIKELPSEGYNSIEVLGFKDEQIEKILLAAYTEAEKFRADWISRIIELSKNNPRLALMATNAVLKEKSIKALKNTIDIYDLYFSKVCADVGLLSDSNYVKAIGVVSFLGSVNRNESNISSIIEKVFNIKWDLLWEAIYKLNDHEIIDVLNNQVCRMSDQVLGTYAFYKCFFDNNTCQVAYSDLIQEFLPSHPKRVARTFVDINNTFTFEVMKELVSPELAKLKGQFANEDSTLFHFYDTFWLYIEAETLLFVREWIAQRPEKKLLTNEMKFVEDQKSWNDNYPSNEPYKILLNFLTQTTDFFATASNLYMQLVFLQNDRAAKMLSKLKGVLAFKLNEHQLEYGRQHQMIDFLIKSGFSDNEQFIADNFFLEIAPVIIQLGHRDASRSNGMTITIYSFQLPKTKSLYSLREKTLKRLFNLAPLYKFQVLKIIIKSLIQRDANCKDIHAKELPLFQVFISGIDSKDYAHCYFVNEYITETKLKEIPSKWKPFIESKLYALSDLLSMNYGSSKEVEVMIAEKRVVFKKYLKGIKPSNAKKLVSQIEEVCVVEAKLEEHRKSDLLHEFFTVLAETDQASFFTAVKAVFDRGYKIPLNENFLLVSLLKDDKIDANAFYKCLNSIENELALFWKLLFFEWIQEKYVSEFYAKELLKTVKALKKPRDFYNLHRYKIYEKFFKSDSGLGKSFLETIIECILEKPIEWRIGIERNVCGKFLIEIPNRVDLLKQIYFRAKEMRSEHDYNGEEMMCLISVDPNFVLEYCKFQMARSKYYQFKDTDRFETLWDVKDAEKYVKAVMDFLIKETDVFGHSEHECNVLFTEKLSDENKIKALNFLYAYIDKNATSEKKLRVAMNIAVNSFENESLEVLSRILTQNSSFSLFKKLDLLENKSITGNLTGVYRKEIAILENIHVLILSLPNQELFLEHILQLNKEIESRKRRIKEEEEEDFEYAMQW